MKSRIAIDKILKLKAEKLSNRKIAEELNVSIRLVEKSLQLNRLREDLRVKINGNRFDKLLSLNFKALKLLPIKDDIGIVNAILDSIEVFTTSCEIEKKLEFVCRNKNVNELQTRINELNDIGESIIAEISELADKYIREIKENNNI